MSDRPVIGSPDGNPKDAIGAKKLDLSVVPDSAIAGMALAFMEGALKYGRFNWRMFPVRFSIYDAAAMRHRAKLRAGEYADPDTRVPHSFSIMACYAIIEDARIQGTLVDDRPPAQEALPAILDEDWKSVQQHLQDLFKACTPHQWTAQDPKP